mgnify:CR=1 FL=1
MAEPEPLPAGHALLAHRGDRLIHTPHVGTSTSRTRVKMTRLTIETLLVGVSGRPPPRAVPGSGAQAAEASTSKAETSNAAAAVESHAPPLPVPPARVQALLHEQWGLVDSAAPGMLEALTGFGVCGRVVKQGKVSIEVFNPREYPYGTHPTGEAERERVG